ncbi:MAG TPA: mechanosensitive ion channel domain-containing protein [Puia sp.]|jgi:small-conductance mechanosensitive channel|nr:mechanosensitive ion channel domain-containing protein [Puia sp.]
MPDQFIDQFDRFPDIVWDCILAGIAIVIGLIVKFMLSLLLKKKPKDGRPAFSVTRSILSFLGQPFSYFLPLLAFNFLLPLMKMKSNVAPVINKIVEILLAITFANVLIGVVKVFEDYVYHHFDIEKADNLKERKIRTQLQFIRRLAISLILILTVCVILLSFNNLRKIGTGLLTGVGVGGIIIGFAAQKSLGNFLAGFQIAFTQPLRIDDVLVVEGEWGRVEEITLTYVVVNIWDQRRLILPINYFVEKPFQNWTRNTADILGTVFLYLDYTIPLDPLRQEFTRLLESNPLWDKRVKVMQVTNASERTIEVRALMSASSSGNAFDLRCDIREGLIKFVQDQYPNSFPVTRALIERKDFLSQPGALLAEPGRAITQPGRQNIESGQTTDPGRSGSHPSEKGDRVGEPGKIG